jgi:hypothetical protein
MRSIAPVALVAFVAQVHAKNVNQASNMHGFMVNTVQDSDSTSDSSMDKMVKKLVLKLLDRTLEVSHVHQTDVDNTTFGKPRHPSVPRGSSPYFATSRLPSTFPMTGPRPVPNLIARRVHYLEDSKLKSLVHRPVTVSAATSETVLQTEAESDAESASAVTGEDLEAIYGLPPLIPKYGEVTQIKSEEDFDNILQQSSGLVLLEVVMRLCRACKKFEPTYQRMAMDYYGKVIFLKVLYNENESTFRLTKSRLKLKETPSFFVFRDGQLLTNTTGANRTLLCSTLDECIIHGTPKEQPSQVQA